MDIVLGKHHSPTTTLKSKTLREEVGAVRFHLTQNRPGVAFAPFFWLLDITGPAKIQCSRGFHVGTSQEAWLVGAMVDHKLPHLMTSLLPELSFSGGIFPATSHMTLP